MSLSDCTVLLPSCTGCVLGKEDDGEGIAVTGVVKVSEDEEASYVTVSFEETTLLQES